MTAFAPLMSPIQTPFSVCRQSCLLGFRKTEVDWNTFCCYDCVPCAAGEITNETGIYKMVLNVEISRNGSECGNDAPLDRDDNRTPEHSYIYVTDSQYFKPSSCWVEVGMLLMPTLSM